jgi:hypothetical protein
MKRTLVVLVAALTLVSGCYLGRTASKKQTAYVVNGMGFALGTILVLAAVEPSSSTCEGNEPIGCGFGALGDGLIKMGMLLAAIPILGGSIAGTIATAAVNTEPEPLPAPTAMPRPSTTALVKTPGLAPTSVGLR